MAWCRNLTRRRKLVSSLGLAEAQKPREQQRYNRAGEEIEYQKVAPAAIRYLAITIAEA